MKKEVKRKIIFIVTALIISLILYSLNLNLDQQGKIVLSIMLFAGILWISEAIPLHITALIIPFLLILFTKMPEKEIFYPFFDPVVVLLLGGFVLARGIQKQKLDELIANWFLAKIGSKAKYFLLGLMIISAFLSMWMSNTATTAIMIPIGLVILSYNKIKTKSNFAKVIVLGIAFAATIGGIGTIVGTPPNAIAVKFLADNGINISFLKWMLYALPVVIPLLLVSWLILLAVNKIEVERLKFKKVEKRLTKKQKIVTGIFVLTALLWLTTNLTGLSSATVALIPVISLFLIGILDEKDFSIIGWPTLILIGGGLSLGTAITSAKVDFFIANTFKDLIATFPGIVIIAGIGLLSIVLTLIVSNTATAAILVPIMITLSKAINFDLKTLAIVAAIGASLDFVVPVGTPPNAIAYSTHLVTIKDMAKNGILILISGLIILTLISYFFWV